MMFGLTSGYSKTIIKVGIWRISFTEMDSTGGELHFIWTTSTGGAVWNDP